MELCSMLYGSLDKRAIWGRVDTCICMAESFRCAPETSWNSLGQNTGVGSLFFLQEIFPTQGLNLGLSHGRHCRQTLLPSEPPGKIMVIDGDKSKLTSH